MTNDLTSDLISPIMVEKLEHMAQTGNIEKAIKSFGEMNDDEKDVINKFFKCFNDKSLLDYLLMSEIDLKIDELSEVLSTLNEEECEKINELGIMFKDGELFHYYKTNDIIIAEKEDLSTDDIVSSASIDKDISNDVFDLFGHLFSLAEEVTYQKIKAMR